MCICVYICGLVGSEKILPTLLLLLLLLLRTSSEPDFDPILPRFCIPPVKYLPYFRKDTLYTYEKKNSNSNNTNTARYVPNVGKVDTF